MKNYILTGVVALIVGVVLGYTTHGQPVSVGSASPSGTQQSSPQIAQVTFSAVSTTTYATFYNNGQDRVVKDIYYFVPTLGASVTIQMATSADPVTLNSNTNYLINGTMVSTTPYYTGTSTSISNGLYRLWPAGSYLNAVSSATTTGGGVIGLSYIVE